jgi:hypothetical protein
MSSSACRSALAVLGMYLCGWFNALARDQPVTANDRASGNSLTRVAAGIQPLAVPSAHVHVAPSRHAPVWRVSDDPEISIGSSSTDPRYQFGQITAVLLLGKDVSNRRFVVADNTVPEIRYYDLRGRYITAVGRRGRGPGEFQVITAVIKLPGDSILVFDIRNGRLTIVSPTPAVAGEESVSAGEVPSLPAGTLLGRLPDGRLLYSIRRALGTRRLGYGRDTLTVATARRRTRQLDTLVRLPSAEFVNVNAANAIASVATISKVHPFGNNAVARVWSGEVVAATSETGRLAILGPDGVVRRSIQVAGFPKRLTRDTLQQYFTALSNVGFSKEALADVRERIELFREPAYIPAFSGLMTDDVGLLWVRDFRPLWIDGRVPDEWTVFDRNGRIVARAVTPIHFRPHHIGADFILGVRTDANDEQSVAVYRLFRS